MLSDFADKGNRDAQEVLGAMYYFGIFVSKNYKSAFEWFLKAAENGSPYCQEKIADMYYTNEFVKRNYKQALEWYKKAASQGDLYARLAAIELEQMQLKGEF